MARGKGGDFNVSPAGFISSALRSGLSATSALRDYRAAGGTIRDATWYRLYGQTRAALGAVPDLANLDPTLPPDESAFRPWEASARGHYIYQVDIHIRIVGTDEVVTVPYSFLTDEPVPVDVAIAEGIDIYDAATEEGGSWDDQVVLGATLGGLYRTA